MSASTWRSCVFVRVQGCRGSDAHRALGRSEGSGAPSLGSGFSRSAAAGTLPIRLYGGRRGSGVGPPLAAMQLGFLLLPRPYCSFTADRVATSPGVSLRMGTLSKPRKMGRAPILCDVQMNASQQYSPDWFTGEKERSKSCPE